MEKQKKCPNWVKITLDCLDKYRLKAKPKAPQGYVNLLNKKVKVADKETFAYMNTMMRLESERVGWLNHLEETLPFVDNPDIKQKIEDRIIELRSDKFWVAGEGAYMTDAERHFAYMGKVVESPETPNWKEV